MKKNMILLLIIVLFPTTLFGTNLSIQNMQGGSEERVTFRELDEGETFSCAVIKSDPNSSEIIKIWNAPKGSTFTQGIFTWTPQNGQSGMYEIGFSILDPYTSQLVFSIIKIVVTDTYWTLRCNKKFQYLFTATDPDKEKVEITVSGLPSGATFTGGRFTPKSFSWTPTRNQIGNYQMIITATDFPTEGTSPKQDVRIIHITVVRLSAIDFDFYIDDRIDITYCVLFAGNWLREESNII
jgi:hypothetical protein